ncbi:hypothetical protein [Solimonas sp. SE-A11]|uniref:NYN domain-containing protein n=1 Tax=Solimonas sp. SE-A11 TaxID=3054954 RepID=UPI00259C86D1|nr:hypothetical protein [Solimonas sp. SE-A11]
MDALNLAYWTGQPPSLRAPLTLLARLLEQGQDAVLYFDANARYRLGDERAVYELLLEHPRHCIEVASGKRADGVLLRMATACKGCVVSRDKYRDFRKRYRRLIDDPARLLGGGVRERCLRVPQLQIDVPLPASAQEAWERLAPLLVKDVPRARA